MNACAIVIWYGLIEQYCLVEASCQTKKKPYPQPCKMYTNNFAEPLVAETLVKLFKWHLNWHPLGVNNDVLPKPSHQFRYELISIKLSWSFFSRYFISKGSYTAMIEMCAQNCLISLCTVIRIIPHETNGREFYRALY